MPSYDLHVHSSLTIGENTVEEMALMASKLGLTGIGIVRYSQDVIELPKVEGMDIISCIEIKPKSLEDMDKEIKRVRDKAEILIISGGDYDINRASCENPMVDIIAHPELGRKDSGLDHICAKAAQENNVAIELNFKSLLESYKKKRSNVLSSMKKNVKLCNKYGAKIMVVSGAISQWGMRSAREMAALAKILGMDLGNAILTTSMIPDEMVRTNREKLSGKRIEGARIIE
jgi:RNase P/RNase MRP subunit p30